MLNVGPATIRHLLRSFFKKPELNKDDTIPHIDKKTWSRLGNFMVQHRSQMPKSFGRTVRNISDHMNGFKAEEWSRFLTVYSVPLFDGLVPHTFLKPYSDLIWAISNSFENCSISLERLAQVKSKLLEFYVYYERYLSAFKRNLSILTMQLICT
jgi:hypothetical protein